jgi:hypothetical protein
MRPTNHMKRGRHQLGKARPARAGAATQGERRLCAYVHGMPCQRPDVHSTVYIGVAAVDPPPPLLRRLSSRSPAEG